VKDGLSKYEEVRTTCEELLAGHIRSPYLLSLLVDIYQELGSKQLLEEAVKVCIWLIFIKMELAMAGPSCKGLPEYNTSSVVAMPCVLSLG